MAKLKEIIKYLWDCVIYVRVSTLEQKDGFSPEAQEKAGIQYCKNKGWTYIVMKELGKSANQESLDNRKVLKEVLSLAQQRKFKYLFVIDQDRLSRNLTSYLAVKKILLDNDIQLVTSSNVTDFKDPAQAVQANIMASFSEYENVLRGLRFSRGKQIASKTYGLFVGGMKRYGYATKKVKFGVKERSVRIIDKEQAKGYRLIQDLCLNGLSTTKIAVELTRLGYPSVTGKHWRAVTVLQILRNPFYLGKKSEDGKWLIPPLTDKEKFDRVQAQLYKNKRYCTGPMPRHKILLRGRIFDGDTGKMFTATVQHQRWVYYRPPDNQVPDDLKNFRKKSIMPMIRGSEIEPKVWNKIKEILSNPKTLRKNLQEYRDSVFVNKTEKELQISEIEKELKKIESGLDKVNNDYYNGVITGRKRDEYSQPLKNRRVDCEEKLSRLKASNQEKVQLTDTILKIERKIEAIVESLDSYNLEDKRQLFDLLQVRIDAYYSAENGYMFKISGLFDNFVEERHIEATISNFNLVNQQF